MKQPTFYHLETNAKKKRKKAKARDRNNKRKRVEAKVPNPQIRNHAGLPRLREIAARARETKREREKKKKIIFDNLRHQVGVYRATERRVSPCP